MLASEGYRFRRSQGKYLEVKTPRGRRVTIGPLLEIEEIEKIIEETKALDAF